jgi:hypothetical protein
LSSIRDTVGMNTVSLNDIQQMRERKIRYAKEVEARKEAERLKEEARHLKLKVLLEKFQKDYNLDEIVAHNLAQLLMTCDKQTDDFIAKQVKGLIPKDEIGMILQIGPTVVRLSPEQWATVKKIAGAKTGLFTSSISYVILFFSGRFECGLFSF